MDKEECESNNMVFVPAYTKKDGTYVRSHCAPKKSKDSKLNFLNPFHHYTGENIDNNEFLDMTEDQ